MKPVANGHLRLLIVDSENRRTLFGGWEREERERERVICHMMSTIDNGYQGSKRGHRQKWPLVKIADQKIEGRGREGKETEKREKKDSKR